MSYHRCRTRLPGTTTRAASLLQLLTKRLVIPWVAQKPERRASGPNGQCGPNVPNEGWGESRLSMLDRREASHVRFIRSTGIPDH